MARGRLSRRRAVSRTTSSRSNRVNIKSFVTRTKGQRAEMHRERRQPGTAAIIARILSRGLSLSPVDPHTRGPRCTFPSPCSSELRELNVAIRGHLLRKSIREATRRFSRGFSSRNERQISASFTASVSLLYVGADGDRVRPRSCANVRNEVVQGQPMPRFSIREHSTVCFLVHAGLRGATRSREIDVTL